MNYQNKYLKYKTKYLELKNNIQEGSAFKKIKDCYQITNDNNAILLKSKIEFDRCIEEQTRTGKDNEYFLIFNFYQNISGKLNTSLCYTLNNILFNMDIKPEKIFLLTQYFNKQSIEKIHYDDFKSQPLNEKLIFEGEWQNNCEYLLELFKTNKLNHIMNNNINKSDSNYKQIINDKINQIINLLNDSIIKNGINNAKINIIIMSHGYENVKSINDPLISTDGSNGKINAMSINEIYVSLTNLFRNILVSKIVFLPAFCFNSTFRKFMLETIKNDTTILNKKIYMFSIEPAVKLFKLMTQINDYSYTSSSFDDFINNLKSQYGNKINFNKYFIKEHQNGNIIEQINISNKENDLINEFIESKPKPNPFTYQLFPYSLYENMIEAGSLDLITKIYTKYIYDFEIDANNGKNILNETMFNEYLTKNLVLIGMEFENTKFFESINFKKYVIDDRKAFVKVIEK